MLIPHGLKIRILVHQLLVDWAEAEATRYYRKSDMLWAAPYGAIDGRDTKSEQEATVQFKKYYSKWKSWNLTSLTQRWLDGKAPNYGVILWATNEATDGFDLRFRSSEAYGSDPSDRPHLDMVWSKGADGVFFEGASRDIGTSSGLGTGGGG